MAYVAITKNLLTLIQDKIRVMQNKELNTLSKPPNIIGLEHTNKIEDALWGDLLHLKKVLPKTLLFTHGKDLLVSFNAVFPTPAGSGYSPHTARFYTSRDIWLPRTERHVSDVLRAPTYAAEVEEFPEYVQYQTNVIAISSRWEKVKFDVLDFVQHSKSLNEALKLWPQLEVYIPESYLQKVEAKVSKSKASSHAAEILAKMDTNTAIMSAVSAQMIS